MAPALRKSTRQKTKASTDAAAKASYTRRLRAPLSRKQRYTCNKGPVSVKTRRNLQSVSIGNATNSPLLQLPGEIRNMIFKYAVLSDDGWIALIFNRHNFISRSGPSTQACKDQTSSIAMRLPLVCRQIYSETATLFYSVNCFAFESDDMMLRWLAKRLLAQREAIRTLMLHSTIYERRVLDGEAKSMEPERKKIGD